ncbi:FAD-binding domain-containing protein [Bacillus sp. FJAT-47783]|uniref:FAD-binding domain-containing protein n=1 Tax=Bacillus sp. FJAT-47783 TaxID=2922712 RepID=UPI001FABD8CF|nr:FAD-binding domain-containing protein [Bacillus sp. FJAT-47783]
MNVVLFHRDLRLHDHVPLSEAIQAGPVLPLYLVEPSFWTRGEMSIRHFQFVLESLSHLKTQLEARGAKLFLFIGEVEEALSELLYTFGVFRIFYYEEKERHERIKNWMSEHALPVSSFPKECHFPEIETERQFKKKWKEYMQEEMYPTPRRFPILKLWPKAFRTELDDLYSFKVDGERIRFGLEGGEMNAIETLHTFIQKGSNRESRDLIADFIRDSSSLSPYLSWGNISVRFIVQEVQKALEEGEAKKFEKFVDSLYERSQLSAFYKHDVPSSSKMALKNNWIEGKTGIPIFDAMIRFLQKTGWIDHQSRLAIVSVLKEMKIDEQEIARELAKLLIDYEPTIHLHYIKSCDKVIHPIKLSKKIDPDGEFIKRNIPELKHIPTKYIHEPWKYPGFFYLKYDAPVMDLYKVYTNKKRPMKVHEEQLTFDI